MRKFHDICQTPTETSKSLATLRDQGIVRTLTHPSIRPGTVFVIDACQDETSIKATLSPLETTDDLKTALALSDKGMLSKETLLRMYMQNPLPAIDSKESISAEKKEDKEKVLRKLSEQAFHRKDKRLLEKEEFLKRKESALRDREGALEKERAALKQEELFLLQAKKEASEAQEDAEKEGQDLSLFWEIYSYFLFVVSSGNLFKKRPFLQSAKENRASLLLSKKHHKRKKQKDTTERRMRRMH